MALTAVAAVAAGAAGDGEHGDDVGVGRGAAGVDRARTIVIGRAARQAADDVGGHIVDVEVLVAGDERAERARGRDVEAIARRAGHGAPVGSEAAGGDRAGRGGGRRRRHGEHGDDVGVGEGGDGRRRRKGGRRRKENMESIEADEGRRGRRGGEGRICWSGWSSGWRRRIDAGGGIGGDGQRRLVQRGDERVQAAIVRGVVGRGGDGEVAAGGVAGDHRRPQVGGDGPSRLIARAAEVRDEET